MVLLSGPRQCGKTTLVQALLKGKKGQYLNWDFAADRKAIQTGQLDFSAQLWAFDEIHKFNRWRNFLKGWYDKFHDEHSILVTGSARLEHYSRGGDSLQGRYFLHHLHPLTLAEVTRQPFDGVDDLFELPRNGSAGAREALEKLIRFGGFPEPFLSASEKQAARWRLQYGARLIQEDVRALQNVRELERLELLYDQLGKIGASVLSINSLREDLEVSFETVKNWLTILENLDAIFRISPYGPAKIKAVRKEQKLYFWDSARCETAGAKFENVIAVHLQRFVHWMIDVEGEPWELRFFKHREGQEVDFILMRNRKPVLAIEVKTSDTNLSPALKYILERKLVPVAYQIVREAGLDKIFPPIGNTTARLISADKFLSNLP